MDNLGVGIIGCGNISDAYLSLGPLFAGIEIRACADLNTDAAKVAAERHGIRAETIDGLLAADDIQIVVNLTVPKAHWPVSKDILSAGKHVYSEKPVVLSFEDGIAMRDLASKNGLRVGSAPDTYLGGAHQLARRVIDDGDVGRIVAGTCHVMSHGMEHWHPNPDFFYQVGGGPILDIGPYYVSNLINLIGPVKRVAALANASMTRRQITSEPRAGEFVQVETPTNIHALLEFENGATITLSTSWDIWRHEHNHMELYGTEGTLFVPDPNFFGGDVRVTQEAADPVSVNDWDHPFGVPNTDHKSGRLANYRAAGLADMAVAIQTGRDHRCSLDRALHAVDVMTSILKSGETGSFVDMRTTCTQPDALSPSEAQALLKEIPVAAAS